MPTADDRPDDPTLDLGTAGASARREHARRRANRERRVRERHPHLGGLKLALATAPQHEDAWTLGAVGEERVAAVLARHLRDDVVVLHDRRVPRSRANIDHIAVAPSGVWVIDAKRYQGKRIAVSAPLLGRAKLVVGGRDHTKLVDGLAKQVAIVEAAVAEVAVAASVRGALCFVDGDFPVLGRRTIRGFAVLPPRRLSRLIGTNGPLSPDQVRAVAAALAAAFPAA